jgi:hypothetical protein
MMNSVQFPGLVVVGNAVADGVDAVNGAIIGLSGA